LLASLCAGFVVAVMTRKPVALDVLHDRNALYRVLDDGAAENVYTLKIMNKDDRSHRFDVTVAGPEALRLDPADAVFDVAPGEVFNAAVRVRRDAWSTPGSQAISFTIRARDDARLSAVAEARFFAPSR
jgi:polyferredoxin